MKKLILLVIVFLIIPLVIAQTPEIKHIKFISALNGTDAHISEEGGSADTNFGSAVNILIGLDNGATREFRTLINLSFVRKSIPIGSTINFFKIEFQPIEAQGIKNATDIQVFSIATSWVDSTVTWNGFNGGGVADTDYNSTDLKIEQEPLEYGAGQRINFTLDNDYSQNFFDGTLGDFDEGLLLINPTLVLSSFVNFKSSDAVVLSDRWSVYINFTPPLGDTTSPFFNETSRNNSNPRIDEVVDVSVFAHDETDLSLVRLAHNQSGLLNNVSSLGVSGTDSNASFQFDITLGRGNVIAYQFHITDTAGNTNQTGLFLLNVINTPPQTPTILFPTPSLVTMDQPLDINVTFPSDADLDAITIFYYIDDVLNQTSSFNTTLNASTKSYTLAVSITDGFDFSANATVSFIIDITNPILTITLPLNNSIHAIDIPVSIQCDNLNVFNFSYIFSNATQIFQTEVNDSTGITQSNIFTPINITGLANGTYDFDVNCIDNASNTVSLFFFLTIDTTVIPTVTETEAFQSKFISALSALAVVMFILVAMVSIILSFKEKFKRET